MGDYGAIVRDLELAIAMDDAEVNLSSTATTTHVDDEKQQNASGGRHRKQDSEITVRDDCDNASPWMPSSSDTSSSSRKNRKSRRRALTKCLNAILGWPSLTLENSGSVARDHLASERTFLAYVRTSLGCSTMGVGESNQDI